MALPIEFPRWSLGRWLAAASAAYIGYRIFRDAARVRRRLLPATRLVVPSIILIEVALILAGRATRRSIAPVTAAIELGLVAWGVAAYRRRRHRQEELPENRLEEAIAAFLPRGIARAVAVECVVIGLGLRSCFPPYRRPAPAGFGYTKDAYLKFVPVLFVFTVPADVLLLGEVLPQRLWLLHRAITALDLYGFCWILGFLETMRRRPHRIGTDGVEMFRGILNRARFDRGNVSEAGRLRAFDTSGELKAYARQGNALRMSVAGEPLLEIALREPVLVESLFPPFRRPADRLIVSADEPDDLVRALTSRG
jgi:hypothetical protein